ncbi:MAG: amidohydrolase family protein [Betaproteobacteria bacterium]
MQRPVRLLAAPCALALALALVPAAPAGAADVLYVKAGRLILDATKPPLAPGVLVITDGRITAAGGADIQPPAGARRIDLGTLTVMPSLVDAHTHLGGGPPGNVPGQPLRLTSPAYAALKAQKNVDHALRLGVAAMRVLGTTDFLDVAIRNAVDDGTIPGPHIVPAAHPLSVEGGHDDFAPQPYTLRLADLYTPLHGYVGSPADAEKAVQLQIKYGATVIKLMASGGVGSPLDSPADQNLTLEEMQAAVQQAHMHHLKVAAHAESLDAIMNAMRAGVDSIEHGSDLNQDAVDYMKAHHVVLVPTVHVALTFAAETRQARPGEPGGSSYSQFKGRALAEKHAASFALALKNGVTMAAGSDNSYGADSTGIIAELVSDVEHGMTARQAIETATLNGAALLGIPTLGALEPGMEGDFLAVNGDPLNDIHALQKVEMVVYKGRVVTDETSKKTSQ